MDVASGSGPLHDSGRLLEFGHLPAAGLIPITPLQILTIIVAKTTAMILVVIVLIIEMK